ncbi:MAG TPA: 2-C-methyl-D-erythritol 4-phosphate cytidylyltransferase [Parachlamydiaceae bacterium]|nr:2-C-methyl-D-erythritol 4-phosphate cytidylyltransferase [Parachlamydiaceae bacterium]
MKPKVKTSAILLAGGIGQRMHSTTPKQFLVLDQKPVACYSFELFLEMPEIDEIIVVCLEDFRELFNSTHSHKQVSFALPGERRQDSVFNGLQAASHDLICIHDAARPFIDKEIVSNALEAGKQYGAAAIGMPVKFTVKEIDPENFVIKTPDRSNVWEIQTPQVLQRHILTEGFNYANLHKLTVTDDVSLAELIGKPVKLVEGSHINLKMTFPNDLTIANHILKTLKQ